MFKNLFLHGHGKRINPNAIIEYGIFANGEYLEDPSGFQFDKTAVQLPNKVNWNEYSSN